MSIEVRIPTILRQYTGGEKAVEGSGSTLAELIDAKAAALYARHFRAEPRSFPAFVDADVLHRCGYFDSHPNAISFVGHMVEDFDAIEAFRQANSCAKGALMPDHVHMMISIPPKYAVSQVVGFIKGKSAIHLARVYGEKKRNFVGQHFWARGYFVSTVGRDEAVIREYIRNQEQEDSRLEQMNLWR